MRVSYCRDHPVYVAQSPLACVPWLFFSITPELMTFERYISSLKRSTSTGLDMAPSSLRRVMCQCRRPGHRNAERSGPDRDLMLPAILQPIAGPRCLVTTHLHHLSEGTQSGHTSWQPSPADPSSLAVVTSSLQKARSALFSFHADMSRSCLFIPNLSVDLRFTHPLTRAHCLCLCQCLYLCLCLCLLPLSRSVSVSVSVCVCPLYACLSACLS